MTGTAATEQPVPAGESAPRPGGRPARRRPRLARDGRARRSSPGCPRRPLVAAAESAGELWYRIAPARRDQARANLARVCEGLAATDRGSAAVRRAATDPDALERLVRAAFRHAARYYLEVARAGSYDFETALARLDIDDEDGVREALQHGGPVVIVGMHYGAIELPVVHAVAPRRRARDGAHGDWSTTRRCSAGS